MGKAGALLGFPWSDWPNLQNLGEFGFVRQGMLVPIVIRAWFVLISVAVSARIWGIYWMQHKPPRNLVISASWRAHAPLLRHNWCFLSLRNDCRNCSAETCRCRWRRSELHLLSTWAESEQRMRIYSSHGQSISILSYFLSNCCCLTGIQPRIAFSVHRLGWARFQSLVINHQWWLITHHT